MECIDALQSSIHSIVYLLIQFEGSCGMYNFTYSHGSTAEYMSKFNHRKPVALDDLWDTKPKDDRLVHQFFTSSAKYCTEEAGKWFGSPNFSDWDVGGQQAALATVVYDTVEVSISVDLKKSWNHVIKVRKGHDIILLEPVIPLLIGM